MTTKNAKKATAAKSEKPADQKPVKTAEKPSDGKAEEKQEKPRTPHGYRPGTQAGLLGDTVYAMGKGWCSEVEGITQLTPSRVRGHIVKDPYGMAKRGLVTITDERQHPSGKGKDFYFEVVTLTDEQKAVACSGARTIIQHEEKQGK